MMDCPETYKSSPLLILLEGVIFGWIISTQYGLEGGIITGIALIIITIGCNQIMEDRENELIESLKPVITSRTGSTLRTKDFKKLILSYNLWLGPKQSSSISGYTFTFPLSNAPRKTELKKTLDSGFKQNFIALNIKDHALGAFLTPLLPEHIKPSEIRQFGTETYKGKTNACIKIEEDTAKQAPIQTYNFIVKLKKKLEKS
jgi:hypothetical protein